ncbi:MAG: hypothetical protein JOZ93_10555 [Sinobacteraceae bacterium]|nr:hypothetical protein [Nevskiaceae bacterium]MBV9913013.1 hypothetical protein [Nevskiaceae bacterium]
MRDPKSNDPKHVTKDAADLAASAAAVANPGNSTLSRATSSVTGVTRLIKLLPALWGVAKRRPVVAILAAATVASAIYWTRPSARSVRY